MEIAECSVIYLDRSVSKDRCVSAGAPDSDSVVSQGEAPHVAENVRLLLEVFGEVYLCNSGSACLNQWLELQEDSIVALKPTLFLLDTPLGEQGLDGSDASRSRSPSPSRSSLGDGESRARSQSDGGQTDEELYGLVLLRRIISESYVRNASKLVVTIPIISPPESDRPADDYPDAERDRRVASKRLLKRCLDLGATDVMSNPMNAKCVTNLEVHAYRAHRDAALDQQALVALRRGRTRSWVGIADQKPYSYLREAMVSKLLDRICRIESEIEDVPASIGLSVSSKRQADISSAVGLWEFSAHDFNDDELVEAAMVMFKHALSMPELAPWRISTDQLHRFLLACRRAYIEFVPYHNFRHVVDVLQATFHFLVSIGSLPSYPRLSAATGTKTPFVKLLGPFEALTLLITAIGHDVGHPGVNNGFLITMNAPLAQLYNDRSVLESFHCAAYSQILRRYWPSVFADAKMRNLMISSILATDMSLHFKYMKKLGDLQAKLRADGSTDGWAAPVRDEQTANACAFLIKCADISNVSRQHNIAVQWMEILSDEFSRQATMEVALDIKTSLMSEPKRDMLSLTTAQLKFMELFAIPLFQGVADVLPAMQYCVDELISNREWFRNLQEQERQVPSAPALRGGDSELSPEAVAFTTFPEPPTEAHPAKDQSLGHVPQVVEPSLIANSAVSQHGEAFESLYRDSKRPADRRVVDGIVTTFPVANEYHHSEPFHVDNGHTHGHTRQSRSETTEGSSAPNSGDWASQATSATTGKMPLSPSSTQGTSIVSRDSFDRPGSIPAATIPPAGESTSTVPDAASKDQPDFKLDSCPPLALDEDPHHHYNDFWRNGQVTNGGCAKKNGAVEQLDPAARQLKKRPSRFGFNGLQNLFRKHKSSSPPMQAADTAG